MPEISMNPAPWLDATPGDPVAVVMAGLANHVGAVVQVEALAERLELDVDATWEALGVAESAGWCERWPDAPGGPAACLSSRSTSRLGLRLSNDGRRWLTRNQRDLSSLGYKGKAAVATDCELPTDDLPGLLATLADPEALEGLDSLLWAERAAELAAQVEAEQRAQPGPDGLTRLASAWGGWNAALDEARLPQPAMILGLGPAWPVEWSPGDGSPCPGCQGRRLTVSSYCAICHASGADRLLRDSSKAPADPTGGPPLASRAGRVKVKGSRRARAVPFEDLMAAIGG